MKTINLNELARKVAVLEGKKVKVNIAQIKEVIKYTLIVLEDDYTHIQVLEAIERTSHKEWQRQQNKTDEYDR